jgi:hypothetical protein
MAGFKYSLQNQFHLVLEIISILKNNERLSSSEGVTKSGWESGRGRDILYIPLQVPNFPIPEGDQNKQDVQALIFIENIFYLFSYR